jgi:hypothetical protein
MESTDDGIYFYYKPNNQLGQIQKNIDSYVIGYCTSSRGCDPEKEANQKRYE